MHFETILYALPVPVLVCDRRGQAKYANGTLESLFGKTPPLLTALAAELDGEGAFESGEIKEPRRRVTFSRNGSSDLVLDALVSIVREQGEPVAVLVLEPAPPSAGESLASRRASVAVPSCKQQAPAARARLLVVDDEEMVRMVICAVLTQKGYEVVEAVDGEDALRKCAAGLFDLALVDLFMPRLNGLETLQELRRIQPQLRALLLSGVADVQDFKGWDSTIKINFLQKPFDNRELTRAVEQLLTVPRA